jgi:hypothetical protein
MPDFHPEFGLLCPSPRRRRALRLASLSVATVLAIGTTVALAAARWPAGDGAATPVQPMNEPAPAQTLDAARTHESCKADTERSLASFFLDSTCGKHVRHGGRAAGRVATVIIGRTDVAPEPTVAAPPPTEKSENATPAAAERATPPKRPKAKSSTAIALTAPSANAPNSASTARAGRETYDPYGTIFRSGSPQSGYAPAARSWPQ